MVEVLQHVAYYVYHQSTHLSRARYLIHLLLSPIGPNHKLEALGVTIRFNDIILLHPKAIKLNAPVLSLPFPRTKRVDMKSRMKGPPYIK